jgi:secondary thiamine-phosphate synthase enzyme
MLQQFVHQVSVPTEGRGFYDVTGLVEAKVRATGWQTGLATLHLRHTSASFLIQENADPDVRGDLERFLSRLAPDGVKGYVHTCEGPDDMPAHIRTALTAVNLSIPILRGALALGTWQAIYLWEHRQRPHYREFVLHLLGE